MAHHKKSMKALKLPSTSIKSRGVSGGLSPITPIKPTTFLHDLNIHPPPRLHNLSVSFDRVLSPEQTNILRGVAQKGNHVEKNNRFGTLDSSTWSISPTGKIRVWIHNPAKPRQTIHEFRQFCQERGVNLQGNFIGETRCEIAHPVSGNVKKYVKCKVKITLRDGTEIRVYHDKSKGPWEAEAHIRTKGPPGPAKELAIAVYSRVSEHRFEKRIARIEDRLKDLPRKIAQETYRLLIPRASNLQAASDQLD